MRESAYSHLVHRRFAFLDHPGPIAFAHRGGAAEGHENTMSAFERAIKLGYSYLETDAHATADGVLLAFHDHTLDRVTDRTGRIAELPYREVRKARIGGKHEIPLIEDLLGTWPDVRFNIDVKESWAILPLARAIQRTRAHDRVCICSFSDRRLEQARKAVGREICTALGPRGVLALRAASLGNGYGRLLAGLARQGIPCAQVPAGFRGFPIITRSFIRTAHALGMQVHAWTVDDPATMERLLDLGVDGIMTDNITGLRELLRARGQWHAGERQGTRKASA
ncbi:glycerophosphoryl diester phosphodiesterase [Thermobispora bispora]|uniref:Glycerophosphoryl diester phosphodiesterase n=1 Tax=Thermobispora bispora (strain ATCC 19993 / DSM 43833 / CBS 139.67 / JCM 10125 / KCTC 9307 / NBRC 14880 / R51) TaxID=469371 RepID=D6YBF2_THEBD|nr:glycerophosphoryl diester phosphodiesterase [Thermobispora bispora DSM 43833]MBO2475980.1 glycerophosphodiester phosphodiesterase [Actinomycetales bacterium]MBX6169111.1 glycerophosphodiester phosphodiesterase [Thermobispora bispora]QSI48316.1 glycerophosphodiester phosphodiesterase [Thermobispora bispora]